MVYVGTNIYYWGRMEMRRLLLEGLALWATALRSENLSEGVFYCCFDARGPHLFALFATAPEKVVPLRQALDSHVRDFLLRFPSKENLNHEELEERHRACRGTALCVADRGETIARNNSFEIFSHELRDYPLWLSEGMKDAEEFWRRLDRLSLWALQHLDNAPTAMAVRSLVATDRFLKNNGLEAENYWRFHATTLVPPLSERLRVESALEVQQSLRHVLNERNRAGMAKIWDEPGAGNLGFDLDGLLELIFAKDGRAFDRQIRALRELNHIMLGQLGQRVAVQIPMILYAWERNLPTC